MQVVRKAPVAVDRNWRVLWLWHLASNPQSPRRFSLSLSISISLKFLFKFKFQSPEPESESTYLTATAPSYAGLYNSGQWNGIDET